MSLLAKAKICACNEKGSEHGGGFYVQFNPNAISINEYVGRFADKNTNQPPPSGTASQQTPSGVQTSPGDDLKGITFSTKLFFNTYNSAADYGDVRIPIKKFDGFLNKSTKDSSKLKRIRFSWGSIQVFGLLTSMSVSYTMFSRDGYPVRAEASISIKGDYVEYSSTKEYSALEQSTAPKEKFSGFAAALNAYGSMDKLKTASRASGITNGRTQK